ncbi:hypothetical protein VTN77DRAFT_6063 [Rasamsonia byssochlamydoides]|uniref:uncharacterized protein n=1 Tax=Rasamsonia byssochlamydoides TaxID=89139 RepID=UPI003743A7B4
MRHSHAAHHAIHHRERRIARPEPVPLNRIPHLTVAETPSFVRRDAIPSSTCGPNNNSPACAKPTSASLTTTLPVVLGAVIPIVCAMVALLILHRRNVKKLKHEDANDKHKSLDFGMDYVEPGGGKGGRKPEMSTTGGEKHKRGGMSLDIGNSPYLLPPGLHNSKESLRSLSRSISIDDDKYRPATSMLGGDNSSLRSYPSRPGWGQDDASSIAGSARRAPVDDMQQSLLRNAQRISTSTPPPEVSSRIDNNVHESMKAGMDEVHTENGPSRNIGLSPEAAQQAASHTSVHGVVITESDNYQGPSSHSREPSLNHREGDKDHTASHTTDEVRPGQDSGLQDFNFALNDHHSSSDHQPIPTIQEPPVASGSAAPPRISLPLSDATSDYGDDPKSEPAPPAVNVSAADEPKTDGPTQSAQSANRRTQQFSSFDDGFDPHLLTVGIRPLPPEDPSDNPEQRANRIRSFYKEYFDESNKGGQEENFEDYGPEFYADGVVYDPTTGEYLTGPPKPFAEPVGRRAMTPPPRFQGPARHMATNSAGGGIMPPPGPRAFSSASGRLPGPRAPKKPAPPPAPLRVLPSPALLKDDESINPIDFAPGKTLKDQREGRPETPRGGLRPYTPTVPAHVPLVSSFDDLAAIPSPHALRKSGVYSTLDFAPPVRFKNNETGSDAGSIRSNRTGISATHLHNIRAGAYRVSRLPADTVGTKDDIASNLRPKWDMR